MRQPVPMLLLVAALAAAPACREEPAEEAAPVPPPAEVSPPLTPDERLAEDVRRALSQAPALGDQEIKISVRQGQVFLFGDVTAGHLRDEAVAIAGNVPGVRGVQSKINVRRR